MLTLANPPSLRGDSLCSPTLKIHIHIHFLTQHYEYNNDSRWTRPPAVKKSFITSMLK